MFEAPKKPAPKNQIKYRRRVNPKKVHKDKPVEYRGAVLDVTDIENKSVDPAMLKELQMDLTARRELPPKMTDDALIQTTEHYLAQCSASDASATYEGMLVQHIVPELIERLKQKDLAE